MRSRPLAVFFSLAFAVTWVVWVPRALLAPTSPGGGLFEGLGAVWTYGPAIAAVLAAAWTGGRSGLAELGGRAARWRVGAWWYVVALVVLPTLLLGLTIGLGLLTGGDVEVRSLEAGVSGLLVAFVVLSLSDGLGEEIGWRGWALPRLLERVRATEASVLLGLVWAAWHLPLHATAGSYLADVPPWVLFARLPATSIVFTWVFRHTHGSALVAVLLHGALNVAGGTVQPGTAADVAGIAAHWIVAVGLVSVAGRDLDRWPRRRAIADDARSARSPV
jgi:uncharacterized protein